MALDPLTPTGRNSDFLNSTCDIELIDMQQGFQNYSDMRQDYFLNSTCDIGINKRQGHATLAFLKFDRRNGDPPSRAPQWFGALEEGREGTGNKDVNVVDRAHP